MSKTADLDKTITMLNAMLKKAKLTKDKLAITDRLVRCHALKYKHADDGQGGKFMTPDNEPPEPTGAHTNGR